MEGLRAGGDDQIDREQQERRYDGCLARALGRILGLLVDRHTRVPAPVDEHPEQDRDDQIAELHREGIEPGQRRLDRVSRGMAAEDLKKEDGKSAGAGKKLEKNT